MAFELTIAGVVSRMWTIRIRRAAGLLLVMFLALAPAIVEATAIVVFRQTDRIILAADSIVTIASTSHEGTKTTFKMDCKVRRAGRWWFVVGGIQSLNDGTYIFTLVTRAITPTSSVLQAVTAIRDEVNRKHDQLKLALQDFPMLHVIVGGLDGGELVVGIYAAELKQQEPFEVTVKGGTCPGAWCPDGRVFYGGSVSSDMFKLLDARPRLPWVQRGDAKAARRLISLQIAATPGRVGPPVDVLEIRGDGRATWVRREADSNCEELKAR